MISLLLVLLFLLGCWRLGRTACFRFAPELAGSAGVLAAGVVALSLVVVSSEIAGVVALFKPVVLGAIGLLMLVSSLLFKADDLPGGPQIPDPERSSITIAVVASAAVLITWAGPIAESLDGGIYRQDSLWYHLTFAAGFVQDGQIGGLQITDPLKLAAWFYPQNSEILHGIGMLAFGDDFASPFLNLFWAGFTLLACWCIGRRFGRPATATVAGALVLVTPMMLTQAGNAPNDAMGLALMIASVALILTVVRDLRKVDPKPVLAVAGLAIGLAAGTKLTLLLPAVLLGGGLILLSKRGSRLRTGLLWFLPAFLTCGFWYIRNLILAGNPLPWFQAGPLTGPDQLDIYPRPAHSLAEYAGRTDDWFDQLLPGIHSALGLAWPVIVGLSLAGILLCLFMKRRPVLALLAWTSLAMMITHVFTPISASGPLGYPSGFATNLRYVAAAYLLGMLALIGREHGRARNFISVLLGIGLLVNFLGELSGRVGAWILVVTIAALAALACVAMTRRPAWPRLIAAVAAVLLLGVSATLARSSYLDQRYLPEKIPIGATPGFRTSTDWVPIQAWARLVEDARIGVVGPSGVFAQYFFYGPERRNVVSYIGVEGPHGSMRPATSCREWREAVNRFDPDFLIFTPPADTGGDLESEEAFWTRTDRATHEILRSSPASIFLVGRPLSPEGCKIVDGVRMIPQEWGGFSPVPQSAFPEPPYVPFEELLGSPD